MFVKLVFNTGTAAWNTFKILDYLINQRPATGTNLQTYITAVNSTLGALIDGTNSAIWNSGTGITALTSNTKSVYYKPTTTLYSYRWAVELSGYDNTASHKHVVELRDLNAASSTSTNDPLIFHYWNTAGTSISAITSEAIGTFSVNSAATSGTGTYPTLTNQSPSVSYGNLYDANYTGTSMTGAMMYITDNCFMLSFNGASTKWPNGFPAGSFLSNLGYYRGVHLVAAYNRIDPWNTSANGVPPFVCSQQGSPNNIGNGFLASLNQATYIQNTGGTGGAIGSSALVADRQLNNAYSSTNSTQPWVAGGNVNFGCGNRFNDVYGLSESSIDPGSSSQYSITTGANTGNPLNRTAGTRYLASDLKSTTYALLPFTWANSFYNNNGGNITDRTGLYWFNGDYFPGDILTSGTKTYVLWPGAFSQVERIALAVPRE
jgi:hypothetical protein